MKKLEDIKRVSVREYIDTSVEENKKAGTWVYTNARDHLLKLGYKEEELGRSFYEVTCLLRKIALTGENPMRLGWSYALKELNRKVIEDLLLFCKESGVMAYKVRNEINKDKQINMFVGMGAAHLSMALEITELFVDIMPYYPKETDKKAEMPSLMAVYKYDSAIMADYKVRE